MSMTPAAKAQLSKTIRSLRASLLDDLQAETGRVYRLAIKAKEAELNQATLVRRQRLEAWLDEQVRAEAVRGKQQRSRDDFRGDVVKQAAYTLLNRLVFLRLLEAFEQRSPQVVTGGWNSLGYKNFREIAPALIRNDETEGYAFLLKLVFEDLAIDLPGLYGPAGMADLIPVPAKTLRAIVDAFDDKELRSCWTDDMTLGWVYQYWNDPEREALDDKINAGGKIEPHEIASKTQMFTERYMVDWLLQNSLGPMWLAMCKKQGWTPEVEADGTLDRLEQRRIEWRAKRDAGEVSLTELMPLHTDAERRWAYYVPQPIPQDAIDHAPQSVWDLKILDPAVGSGHFLVVAFDLLFALYQEEARHRAPADPINPMLPISPMGLMGSMGSMEDASSSRAIVEHILSSNLHGIDLDPRAVQIAAAALWLKGRLTCAEARPEQLNLVASNLRLASLPDDDPALVELRRAVEAETGIPGTLTDEIVHALRGADHLGSLLKIDAAVEDAIARHEAQVRSAGDTTQRELFDAPALKGPDSIVQGNALGTSATQAERALKGRDTTNIVSPLQGLESTSPSPTQGDALGYRVMPFQGGTARTRDVLKASVLERLEEFMSRHTSGDDLGLRLRGEQLTAGVRFLRLVREATYDLVVGNPPYQNTSKLRDDVYARKNYGRMAGGRGTPDLFAAFLERGLQLVRAGGTSALLTMRSWMFIKQYTEIREWLVKTYDLRSIGDFDRGAFEDIRDERVAVAVSIFRRAQPETVQSVAIQPTPLDDRTRDSDRTQRKRARTLSHFGLHQFQPRDLQVVREWPLIYWWNGDQIAAYATSPKVFEHCPARAGLQTANDPRFLRRPWEVHALSDQRKVWEPYIKGAEGRQWIEPLTSLIRWVQLGLDIKVAEVNGKQAARPQNEKYFFRRGIAITTAGAEFAARAHSHTGIFGDKGRSLFPQNVGSVVCSLNSRVSREMMSAFNPTIDFTVGDVNRLPLLPVHGSEIIFAAIECAFSIHESHREPSVEFREPGASPWRHAQEWAQAAVDRAEGAPLPDYEPQSDAEPPTDHLSFALGVTLGRFGAHGEEAHVPAGILFLDGTLDTNDRRDGLGHLAAKPLLDAWEQYGSAIASRSHLREYLREKFFADVHRQMYENRPIHWPLSSEKKTFVAWITIHRWTESTLRVLLADHLSPTLTRLDGELTDLRAARDGADRKAAKEAEKRFGDVVKARDELAAFIKQVELCAERGPPPTDAACPPREVDARYAPDLDDGVMINSAALWPLLTPQWKDPKKWWQELATSKGKKDYDWSHLAMRYWPTRVDAKCQQDPSLGVAHGCFWKYHPARAWAWELRLQDEIGPDFRIEEAPFGSAVARHRFGILGAALSEPAKESRSATIQSGVEPPHSQSRTTRPESAHPAERDDTGYRAAFLCEHPDLAIAAIEKEALRRRRKQKTPQPQLQILEPGLWSAVPDQVWQLELRLSEKQGCEFRLLAPDEPAARSTYAAANPKLVQARKELLASLAPAADLFADDEEAAPSDDEESGEVETGETDE